MAQRPLKSAWIGPALLAVLPLALLWHPDPVRAEADEGAVEITVVGRSLSLDARSVPLDLLLERLASARASSLTKPATIANSVLNGSGGA